MKGMANELKYTHWMTLSTKVGANVMPFGFWNMIDMQ